MSATNHLERFLHMQTKW